MTLGLVADIGGTNARFGLVSRVNSSQGSFRVVKQASFKCREFDSLEDVIDAYGQSIDQPLPKIASIAIAAPVSGERVRMTNLAWSFSREDLRNRLGLDHLELINDAAAGALAAIRLPQSEMTVIRAGEIRAEGARVNLIPGTGFGVAAALPFRDFWIPVQGEGGHIGLSAGNTEEFEILRVIAGSQGRVSPETVLSGPGLINLYKAIGKIRGLRTPSINPEELTMRAMSGHGEICYQTIEKYCDFLASLAGDYALVFGAHGGVYLSGNILRSIDKELLRGAFSRRFADKGSISAELADISVHRMNIEQPGLWGAATCLVLTLEQSNQAVLGVVA